MIQDKNGLTEMAKKKKKGSTCAIIYKVTESSVPMSSLYMVPTSVLSFQAGHDCNCVHWSGWLFTKKCLVDQ